MNNLKFSKTLVLFLFSFNCSIVLSYSQPTVDWRNYSWVSNDYNPPHGSVDQRHSDYDWWYDHCTGYQDPITKTNHIGYIACGVSKYRADQTTVINYDERGPLVSGQYTGGCAFREAPFYRSTCREYSYNNFENPVSGKLGLGFNTVGRVLPDGTLDYLITMNVEGEYLRTKQLQDGTFLTVGHSLATRKRNGDPMYYNPTSSSPTNMFNYNEIFANGACHRNSSHWDIMKFDGQDGTCLFNYIYGIYDFTPSLPVYPYTQTATICCPDNVTINAKQLSYFSVGIANDFVQEPNATGNIAVVGVVQNVTTQYTGKAAIIKIDIDGNVLEKQFIDNSSNTNSSVARAIEFATINGIDYYFIAVTRSNVSGIGAAEVDILRIPTTLNSIPVLIHTFSASPGKSCTSWSMEKQGNKLYVLTITNSDNVWFSGDNTGELRLEIIDLNTSTVLPSPPPITNVHAFDLKAKMTELSNGNFGVVSSAKKEDWTILCPTTTIPEYILGYPGSPAGIGHWNTDTYVAELDSDGQKIWNKTTMLIPPLIVKTFLPL